MRWGVFIVCIMGWAWPAWALTCPTPVQPQVVMNVAEDPIQYDLSKNRTMLNQLGGSALVARRTFNSNSYVGGLTNGTIDSDVQAEVQALTSSDGSACLWVSKVNIQINYHPVVYVSHEFMPGTCYYAAVLEHEHKHVATDLNLISQFGPILQQAVQEVAVQNGHVGPFPKDQIETIDQNIHGIFQSRLNEVMDRMSATRQTAQAQIDVPQEYARVQALCRNWP